MGKEELLPVDEFCVYYNAEFSFVNSLHEHGLIEVTTIQEKTFVNKDQLHELEKYTRMYYEMDINLEGIEAINHLLQRIDNMQHEILKLHNKLHID